MVERGGIHVSGGVRLPVRRLQTSKGVGLHSQRQRRAEGRQAIPRFITARLRARDPVEPVSIT